MEAIKVPTTRFLISFLLRLSVFCRLLSEGLLSLVLTVFCRLFSRASVAQLVRARDCQSLGRRFDSVKSPTTQIPMNLNFIDPQTRVLNYF